MENPRHPGRFCAGCIFHPSTSTSTVARRDGAVHNYPQMSENNTKSPLWRAASTTYKSARRIAVTVVGASVVLIGVAMLVLPGPALVVIPIGLAILGVEFAWARRWLENIKAGTEKGLNRC